MQRPIDFQIVVQSQAEHAALWADLVKAGYKVSHNKDELDFKGPECYIKHSHNPSWIWTSKFDSDKPTYSAETFRAVFSELFEQKATMDDIIRMVNLDQELGCMQAEMDNLQAMIDEKQHALVAMQKKFNIAP